VAKVLLVGVTGLQVEGTRIVAVKAVVVVVAVFPPVVTAASPAALAFQAGGGEGGPPASGVCGGHVLGLRRCSLKNMAREPLQELLQAVFILLFWVA
jgi:hypothetical protein